MEDRILKALHQPSFSALTTWIELNYARAWQDKPKDAAIAEELAKSMKPDQQKPDELADIARTILHPNWAPPHSPRILWCGHKQQITDLQAGDTVMTPEGVWQIHADFTEHLILNQKEFSAIPNTLRPKSNSALTIIMSDDTAIEEQDVPDVIPPHSTILNRGEQKLLVKNLNHEINKKPDGLYICGPNSFILQHTVTVLRRLCEHTLNQSIINHPKSVSLHSVLGVKTDIQLTQLAQKKQADITKIYADKNIPLMDDENKHYLNTTLAQSLGLHRLSNSQLKVLNYAGYTYAPSRSNRILRTNSKDTILDADDFTFNPGDIFIVSEGVYQIPVQGGPAFQILNRTQMQSMLSSEMLPQDSTDIEIILPRTQIKTPNESDDADAETVLNKNVPLTQALNQAMANHPRALYLEEGNEELSKVLALTSILSLLAQKEEERRQLQHNLIFQTLHIKSDAEFMDYFTDSVKDIPHPPKPLPPIDLVAHFNATMKIDWSTFNNEQLLTFCHQCDIWTPQTSSRIVCCHKRPADYRVGDTLLLPDGVYQLFIHPSSGKIQERKLMGRAELIKTQLNDYLPRSSDDITIIEDFSEESAKDISAVLNPRILKNHQGIYLYPQQDRATESYGAINLALKQQAEQELKQRLLQRFQGTAPKKSLLHGWRLFDKKPQKPPTISKSNELEKPAKTPIKTLRTQLKHLKKFKKTLVLSERVTPSPNTMLIETNETPEQPRTLHDVQESLNDIKDDLELTLGKSLATEIKEEEQVVQLLEHKTIMLEANTDSVVMYKPLLQESKFTDRKKAELFLQALGIPPSEGKDHVVVRGGKRAIRTAVRELFQEFKEQERLEKESTSTNSTDFSF
jgi:hypothetical protein